jgi:hypothetical protein
MKNVITYNLSDDFIARLASYIHTNFKNSDNDYSRVACVFGGRRPGLFLRRQLSRHIRGSFIPPAHFSIDDFIEYLIPASLRRRPLEELDASFIMYTLAGQHFPSLLKGNMSFAGFLAWAKELVSFIEQLDLEQIDNKSLLDIEKSAEIGYDIPESINRLLEHISQLRTRYHETVESRGMYSRGMRYRLAAQCVQKAGLDEFDAVIFCNFFYLHASELEILKAILDKKKGICVFQGSEQKWSVLERIGRQLGKSILTEEPKASDSNVYFYEGFDMHSQASLARHILDTKIGKKENALILVPRPQMLIPLLSEISSGLDDFNVSMGYPLQRSSLYSLFYSLRKVQESKKGNYYYSKDYLDVLKHPLVKNLKIDDDPRITRVMVHKIEELLGGSQESSIGGSLFVTLEDIESQGILYEGVVDTLGHMQIASSRKACQGVLGRLHDILFRSFTEVKDFASFSQRLKALLEVLTTRSMILNFPFNLKVIEKLHRICEEFTKAMFSREPFDPEEIWEIFENKLSGEMISFSGSPLRGTQILGLLETRSLSFENVIVVDANESILPKLKIYEPLIPREVMLHLGLNRLEKEEEIQRYQFMRLIRSSRNAHLIYATDDVNEKSRFIEELLWRKQVASQSLEKFVIPRACFPIKVSSAQTRVPKTPQMLAFLEDQVYSASRINTYLACPLQFYFQYVLGLKEKEDLLENPQSSCIGTFIHELLNEAFQKFKGKKPVIDAGFTKYFFAVMEDKFEREVARRMKSDSFLLKGIIKARLSRFLENERARDVVKILSLEEERSSEYTFNGKSIRFKYTADRIDELPDGSFRIIDYKTGVSDSVPKKLKVLEDMDMNRDSFKENIRSFQLPLYYYFFSKDFPGRDINAELYSIRTLERKSFICSEDYSRKANIMHICLEALGFLFEELFDPGKPFCPDKQERQCRFCPFGDMCK